MAGVWVDKPPLSAEMVTGGVYMAQPSIFALGEQQQWFSCHRPLM